MNTTQLTTILSEQITNLRQGKGDTKVANAIVNAAGKILATQRILLDYAKITKQIPHAPFLDVAKKVRRLSK